MKWLAFLLIIFSWWLILPASQAENPRVLIKTLLGEIVMEVNLIDAPVTEPISSGM